MSNTNEPKLCYAQGNWAYFTTQEIWKQWGDDWDDAPYEHNAGDPYTWGEYDRAKLIEPWTITKIAFFGPFTQPCDGFANSSYSVQAINRGDVPWLSLDGSKTPKVIAGPVTIYAGATISEFCATVRNCGGSVLVELQEEPPPPEPIADRQERFMTSTAELLLSMSRKLNEVAISDQSAAIKRLEAGQRVWPEVITALDKKAADHERRIAAMERFFLRLDALLPKEVE